MNMLKTKQNYGVYIKIHSYRQEDNTFKQLYNIVICVCTLYTKRDKL